MRTSPSPSTFGGRDSSEHDVPLEQPKLGRVLDGDDPLVAGMYAETAFRSVVFPVPVPPEISMFSLPANALREEVGRLLVERSEPDEVVERERIARELPDRQALGRRARAAG